MRIFRCSWTAATLLFYGEEKTDQMHEDVPINMYKCIIWNHNHLQAFRPNIISLLDHTKRLHLGEVQCNDNSSPTTAVFKQIRNSALRPGLSSKPLQPSLGASAATVGASAPCPSAPSYSKCPSSQLHRCASRSSSTTRGHVAFTNANSALAKRTYWLETIKVLKNWERNLDSNNYQPWRKKNT